MAYPIQSITFENASANITSPPSQKDGAFDPSGTIIYFELKFTNIVKQPLADVISFQTDLNEIIGTSNSRVYMTQVLLSDNNSLANGKMIQFADQNLSGTTKMTISVSTGFLSSQNVTLIVKGYIDIS